MTFFPACNIAVHFGLESPYIELSAQESDYEIGRFQKAATRRDAATLVPNCKLRVFKFKLLCRKRHPNDYGGD